MENFCQCEQSGHLSYFFKKKQVIAIITCFCDFLDKNLFWSCSIYIHTASPPRWDYVQVGVCGVLVEEL